MQAEDSIVPENTALYATATAAAWRREGQQDIKWINYCPNDNHHLYMEMVIQHLGGIAGPRVVQVRVISVRARRLRGPGRPGRQRQHALGAQIMSSAEALPHHPTGASQDQRIAASAAKAAATLSRSREAPMNGRCRPRPEKRDTPFFASAALALGSAAFSPHTSPKAEIHHTPLNKLDCKTGCPREPAADRGVCAFGQRARTTDSDFMAPAPSHAAPRSFVIQSATKGE